MYCSVINSNILNKLCYEITDFVQQKAKQRQNDLSIYSLELQEWLCGIFSLSGTHNNISDHLFVSTTSTSSQVLCMYQTMNPHNVATLEQISLPSTHEATERQKGQNLSRVTQLRVAHLPQSIARVPSALTIQTQKQRLPHSTLQAFRVLSQTLLQFFAQVLNKVLLCHFVKVQKN